MNLLCRIWLRVAEKGDERCLTSSGKSALPDIFVTENRVSGDTKFGGVSWDDLSSPEKSHKVEVDPSNVEELMAITGRITIFEVKSDFTLLWLRAVGETMLFSRQLGIAYAFVVVQRWADMPAVITRLFWTMGELWDTFQDCCR